MTSQRKAARIPSQVDRLVTLVAFARGERPHVWTRDTLTGMSPSDGRYLRDLSPDDRRALQTQLAESLDAFVRTGHWRAPVAPLEVQTLDVERLGGAGAGQLIRTCRGPWPAAFWFGAADALASEGLRVRACRECMRLFVRTGRQDSCSTRCASRRRAREHYKRHKDEILKRRRQGYVAAVRAIHPRAKVAQRGRRAAKKR